jgi:tripartite-type tricarboxylate transporter receptor subunit TctC
MKKILAISAVTLLAATGTAQAEWPNDRPIDLIVAFAPGGGTDIMLRTLAPYLKSILGAEIPVLNRPGASGEIAYTALAQSNPDGYTLSSLNTPGFLTMRIGRELGFDPAAICPIARIVEDPGALIVQANSPYQTMEALVAYAKENPGAVSMGTTGVGTDEHLAMLQLEEAAGIDITAVPFAGANEAKTALLGGHVTAIGLNVGEYSTADQNSLKAIGQFAEERSVLAPDLLTAKEQGFDIIQSSERGLATRCDVPEDVRTKLSDAVNQALASPEFLEQAKQQALPLSYLSGADWVEQMPGRLERYTEIFSLIEVGR